MVLANINRFQAFLIHLAISLLIFLVLLLMIVFVWYPQPFFGTDGGWQGIQLIAGVDMVLGPLLTLIVFNRAKPELKRDLLIIALIQISALGAGVWVVHNERPVAVVFNEDRMVPIPGYQFREAGMNMADLQRFGSATPVPVFLDLPTDMDEYSRVTREAQASGQPIYLYGALYVPLDISRLPALERASVDLDQYVLKRPEAEQQVWRDFVGEHPDAMDSYLFIPLHSRLQKFVTVLSRKDLQFVASLDIVPPTDYFAQGGKVIFKVDELRDRWSPQGATQGETGGEAGTNPPPMPFRSVPAAD